MKENDKRITIRMPLKMYKTLVLAAMNKFDNNRKMNEYIVSVLKTHTEYLDLLDKATTKFVWDDPESK